MIQLVSGVYAGYPVILSLLENVSNENVNGPGLQGNKMRMN